MMPPLNRFKRCDVREMIRGGTEPLPFIREQVSKLKPEDGIIIVAPFLPSPLVEKLSGEGFASTVELGTGSGYPPDARAVESSQVLLVQKSGFLALLQRQPQLALRMLGSMSSHLRVLVGQLEDLTLRDVETRLANWLVKRCPNPISEH